MHSLEQVSWLPDYPTRSPSHGPSPQWPRERFYPVQLREQQPYGISLV